MERPVVLAALGVLVLLMLLMLFIRKDKPLTEREKARAHKFWSGYVVFQAVGAIVYAVGCVIFAVVTAAMGHWKVAGIALGFAVLLALTGWAQRGLARSELKKLE